MKPSRSKREGRADRAREIQRGRRGARRGPAPPISGGRAPGAPPRPAACTSPGRGARDRSGRRQRPAGWGGSGHAGPSTGGPVGEPRDRPRRVAPADRPRKGRRAAPARSRPMPLRPSRVGERGRGWAGSPGRPEGPARLDRPRWRRVGGPRPRPVPTAPRRPGSAGDCREPCRPVLKHGPRSLSGPRVGGPQVEAPRRNESEGRLRSGRGGIRPRGGRRTAALPRARRGCGGGRAGTLGPERW